MNAETEKILEDVYLTKSFVEPTVYPDRLQADYDAVSGITSGVRWWSFNGIISVEFGCQFPR